MTKRRGGFVEKFFYTIIAYTHGNISLKNFLCQCAHIPWNLIVSIGREYTADPVLQCYEVFWIRVINAINGNYMITDTIGDISSYIVSCIVTPRPS